MIELEPIEKLIELAIMTGRIEGVRPLSAMIIAPMESAKTETVAEFATTDGVLYLNNFTPASFTEDHLIEFLPGKAYKYHHLIIPDLLNCISRQKYLVDSTITFLNSFTEEGIKEIDSKAFRDSKIVLPQPVRGGVITTIAKADFEKRWQTWSSVGFLTRFLPISFQYGNDVAERILLLSAEEDEIQLLGKPVILPEPTILPKDSPLSKVRVILPKNLAHQLVEPGKHMQKRLKTYGFRGVRLIRRLVQALALANNRDTVIQDDIDEVLELSKFCNLEYAIIGKEEPPERVRDTVGKENHSGQVTAEADTPTLAEEHYFIPLNLESFRMGKSEKEGVGN
jgi:hypothetical protein